MRSTTLTYGYNHDMRSTALTFGYNHDMWSTTRLMFAFQAHLRCLHFSSRPLTTVKDPFIIILKTIIINTALFSIIISKIILITNSLILSKKQLFIN